MYRYLDDMSRKLYMHDCEFARALVSLAHDVPVPSDQVRNRACCVDIVD